MFKRLIAATRQAIASRAATGPALPASMDEALAQLRSRWVAERIVLLPPVPARDVRKVFARLGHVATSDVIALLGVVGGMQEMDDGGFRLWTLDEIAAQEPSSEGVIFADYLIGCWRYWLIPTAGGASAAWSDVHEDPKPCRGLALEAFLACCAQDPAFLHGWA